MSSSRYLTLDPSQREPLLRDGTKQTSPATLPLGRQHTHPRHPSTGDEDASVSFIGTATTVIEWQGIRILTDPNFLHAGDHVHLGPGVSAERKTNPAINLEELPAVDAILLSHYHEDHFDKLVERSLNRDFPIITTPHAESCLASSDLKTEPFTRVQALDFFQDIHLNIVSPSPGAQEKHPAIKVTGMPGKHVPPGPLSVANDLLHAVPPTNGWMLELGYCPRLGFESNHSAGLETGYRIYISGDTLFVDDLKKIPEWLQHQRVDLMLVHLGGTTIPGRSAPLLMVTMDAKQGIQLMKLVDPDVAIPIHYDDYDAFLSSLDDFKQAVNEEKKNDGVVYLDRGEHYRFKVRGG